MQSSSSCVGSADPPAAISPCLQPKQAVAQLAAAIAGGRAQAAGMLVLALEHPPTHYTHICSPTSVSLTVLDGFTDPHGWGSLLGSVSPTSSGSSGGSDAHSVIPLPGLLAASDGLQQLRQRLHGELEAAAGLRQCLIIDSLTPLLDAWGPTAVAGLLQSLQAAPAASCLLTLVHTDLHRAPALAAIQQLAAGSLALQPSGELERSVCRAVHGTDPQGRLALRLKRAAGRVRAEAQMYCVGASGAVAFLEPPADLLNPQAAGEKAAAAAAGGGA